ncbi:transketolase-like TK C-terminal-containing protein [Gordoniibacillus kamchatkensis]|uniref:transketolase-like TK C-terminal-containing protein n=1 Tax=Gordoniibacillus kamchatkensis TaxID=1590651 RepID=UPI00373AE175
MRHQSGPCALILSRQALPILAGSSAWAFDGVARGAYVLSDAKNGKPQAQIIATGSEVQLALNAQKQLEEQGTPTRVISMPSWELFDNQPQAYKDSVILPDAPATLTVEMGSTQGWHRYAGTRGAVMGIDRFGASAPAAVLIREYGFTAEQIVSRVKALLAK